MARKLIVSVLAGVLLAGCGGKKRAAREAARENARQTVSNTETIHPESVPGWLPEDTGKFIFFVIDSPEHYVRTFAEVAQAEMETYGIPASITLAQGLLESGFGQGELTRKTNNHFGIKCHVGWEGEYARHDDDARGECFRKYNHPMYSFRDHSIFLSSRSRYASLFELDQDDYKGWARGLKAAGYATDRRYPQKLIELVERYGLQQYDQAVLGRPGYHRAIAQNPGRTGSANGSGGSSTSLVAAGDYREHRVRAGDTLYGLSRHYGMTVNELMEVNRLNSSDISVGQVLKVRKGAKR